MRHTLITTLESRYPSLVEAMPEYEFSTRLHSLSFCESQLFSEVLQQFVEGTERVLVLIGEAGSGKSMRTYQWAKACLQSEEAHTPLVLWVPLRVWRGTTFPDIATALEEVGLTLEEYQRWQERKNVFYWVFDGYDEWGLWQNLSLQPLFQTGKHKIIITCRPSLLLSHRDYPQFFMPYFQGQAQPRYYSEWQIEACDPSEMQRYGGTKHLEPAWQPLMTTPLGIQWIGEARTHLLSTQHSTSPLSGAPSSLSDIFSYYLTALCARQAKKYARDSETAAVLEKKLRHHAIYVATCFKQAGVSEVFYNPSRFSSSKERSEKQGRIWTTCFGPEVTPLWQQLGFMVRDHQHVYRFQPSVWQSYLATCPLSPSPHRPAPVAPVPLSPASTLIPLTPSSVSSLRSDALLDCMVIEEGLVQALAEHVPKNAALTQRLFDYIEVSKADPDTATAASNAVTILNRAGVSFSQRDWTGIRIPGADLRGAVCDHTCFAHADLARVQWEGAYLREACFTHSNWENTVLHQRAYWAGHRAAITALGVTTTLSLPRVVSTSEDASWIIWDIESGTPLVRQYLHHGPVTHLAYHPAGEMLITAGADGMVQCWVAKTHMAHLFWRRSSEEETIQACSVDFERCLLFLSTNTRLYALSYRSFYEDQALPSVLWSHAQHNPYNIAISHIKVLVLQASQELLYAGQANGWLTLIQATTGEKIGTWKLSTDPISCMSLSEEGRLLAVGNTAGFLILWDTNHKDQSVIQAISAHRGPVTALCFVRQTIVSAGTDSKIKQWSCKDGQLIEQSQRHSGSIAALVCLYHLQEFVLLSAGADRAIRIGKTASFSQSEKESVLSSALFVSPTLQDEDIPILHLVSLPGDRVLSIDQQGRCVVREASRGTLWKRWREDLLPPASPLETHWLQGRVCVTTVDTTQEKATVLQGPVLSVCAVLKIDSQAWMVVGCSDGTLRILLTDTGQLWGSPIPAHTAPITAILHHQRKLLITADQRGHLMGWTLLPDQTASPKPPTLILLWSTHPRLVVTDALFENTIGLLPSHIHLFGQLGGLNLEMARVGLYNALLTHQAAEVKKRLDYYPSLIGVPLEDQKTIWPLACQYSPWPVIGAVIEACLQSKKGDIQGLSDSILQNPDDPHNPLALALTHNNWETIYSLLQYKALGLNLEAVKKLGWHQRPRAMPALTRVVATACQRLDADNLKIIEYLLILGVDPNIPTADGRTLLMYIGNTKGCATIAALLRQYGAQVEKTDYQGNTPLLYAASHGQTHYVDWLLTEAKVNPHALNTEQNDALLCAAYAHHRETADLLLHHPVYMSDQNVRDTIKERIKKALHHGKSAIRYQEEAVRAVQVLAALVPPDEQDQYELDVSSMNLGPSGMQLLARALTPPPPLTTLDLHNNGLQKIGCEALQKIIPALVTLRNLNVRSNHLQDTEVLGLLEAILKIIPSSNQDSSAAFSFFLDIRDNRVSESGLTAVRSRSQHFPIKCFDAYNIPISQRASPLPPAQTVAKTGIFGSFKSLSPSSSAPRVS